MAGRVLGGRYTVQDKIGTGGMATVFRGVDNVLGRTVAIKTMLPQYASDPSFAARFKQEAQAAAGLQSPYIVSVYDWGKDGDTYYIVMEYLRGTDLKSGIKVHGPLECKKVAQIGSQIASALSVAHRHDIIHRDIKPQNIMVQPDGNIKVMDFGIARAKNSHLTTDNNVLGTAHYVSPEQTQGKELGATTDIYSLGVVMYEAACGRVPFDGPDAISVALKQVQEQPVPPSQINPKVDPSLEGIILKCMQKNPADRFQTAEDLRRTLNDYLAGRYQAVGAATTNIGSPTNMSRVNENDPGATSTRTLPKATVTPLPANKHYGATGRANARREIEPEITRRKDHSFIWKFLGALIAIAAVGALVYTIANGGLSGAEVSETASVPNYVGSTQDAAQNAILNENYFKLGPISREYSDTVEEGTVIEQSPRPGSMAARGTAIELTISKGKEPAKSVTVPDLTNRTPTEAQNLLETLGLVAKVGTEVASETVAVGRVASQEPAGSTTAYAGDSVTYHVSTGPEKVVVPMFVGEPESSIDSLAGDNLNVVVTYAHSSSTSYGYVMYQSQVAGAEVAKGTSVTVTVSTGPAPSYDSDTGSDTGSDDTYYDGGEEDTGEGSSGEEGEEY